MSVDGRQVTGGYREGTRSWPARSTPRAARCSCARATRCSIRVDYSSKSGLFGTSIQLQWQPPSQSGIPAAVAAARRSDAAVVFVNNAQGEGMDRSTLALPGDQDALIEAVAAVNRHTIVVLNNGGPVLMPWLHHVDAVLQAWYPGQQFGAALAAVLFGDSRSGRAPAGDVSRRATRRARRCSADPARYPGVGGNESYAEGIFVGYRWYDEFGQRPLFPFGYGLSYARFRLNHLQVLGGSRGAFVSVRVRNTSRRTGSQVVQLYLGFPRSAGEPPKQLKGYRKVTLRTGREPRRAAAGAPRRPARLPGRRLGRAARALHGAGRHLVARPAAARQLRGGAVAREAE